MFSALLAFLGGNVFRMLFGEVVSYLNKKQDHSFEVERMRLQGDLDSAQHERHQAAIRLQSELGIKTIQVAAEAAVGQIEAEGWLETVRGTTRQVGIWFIDAWNGVIRPFVATWAVLMLTLHFASMGWVLGAELTQGQHGGTAKGGPRADYQSAKRGGAGCWLIRQTR